MIFDAGRTKNLVEDVDASIQETAGVLSEMDAQLAREQDNFMITRGTLAAWKHALTVSGGIVEEVMESATVLANAVANVGKNGLGPRDIPE